jgi:hypothetical protein
VLVTYVDRCTSCACSSLRDDAGRRPVPGVTSCGRSCRCHAAELAAASSVRAVEAATSADAARFRFWRRSRSGEGAVAASR